MFARPTKPQIARPRCIRNVRVPFCQKFSAGRSVGSICPCRNSRPPPRPLARLSPFSVSIPSAVVLARFIQTFGLLTSLVRWNAHASYSCPCPGQRADTGGLSLIAEPCFIGNVLGLENLCQCSDTERAFSCITMHKNRIRWKTDEMNLSPCSCGSNAH